MHTFRIKLQLNLYKAVMALTLFFIASQEAKDKIVNNFHAYCTEMEGAAIAHAAYLNKVSYVIIRAISDKADNSAHVDYPEFEKMAIARNIKLVQEMLTSM